jgi:hypothetical protein
MKRIYNEYFVSSLEFRMRNYQKVHIDNIGGLETIGILSVVTLPPPSNMNFRQNNLEQIFMSASELR